MTLTCFVIGIYSKTVLLNGLDSKQTGNSLPHGRKQTKGRLQFEPKTC